MDNQISMFDLMVKPEEEIKIPEPSAYEGKIYQIPDDVWENRCIHCVHKVGVNNIPMDIRTLESHRYSTVIPCQILRLVRFDILPGECSSFAPKVGTWGICESCKHNSVFCEGYCRKADHAPERQVFRLAVKFGNEFDDYYGRHIVSTCDDYDPDDWAKKLGEIRR